MVQLITSWNINCSLLIQMENMTNSNKPTDIGVIPDEFNYDGCVENNKINREEAGKELARMLNSFLVKEINNEKSVFEKKNRKNFDSFPEVHRRMVGWLKTTKGGSTYMQECTFWCDYNLGAHVFVTIENISDLVPSFSFEFSFTLDKVKLGNLELEWIPVIYGDVTKRLADQQGIITLE